MNELRLIGTAAAEPVFSHTSHGYSFMSFPLSVCRLSGACDLISVIAPKSLTLGLEPGETLELNGELRSYNDREAVHNRLKINAWARTLTRCDGEHMNRVELRGRLCKPAVYRRTPFGREIADMMLCVRREPLPGAAPRFDYLPCIAWGSVARLCAELDEHAELHIIGRIQSRSYMKQLDGVLCERTAYEVSIASAEPVEAENTAKALL